MSLSTEWDDEQALRQQGGMGDIDPAVGASMDDVPPLNTAGAAPPPPEPEPQAATGLEVPPEPKPATAVDLLAQVRGGKVTRPAMDAAFGPSKPPPLEQRGQAQGLDWKELADKLDRAHQRAGMDRLVQNVFANSANSGKYVDDPGIGSDAIARAKEPLELARAKQGMDIQNAQEGDRKANLQRQTDSDKLRAELARAGWAQKSKDAEAKAAGDKSKEEMAAEQRAVTEGDRLQDEARKARESSTREKLAQDEFDWKKAHQKLVSGQGAKAKAVADKEAKAAENADLAADELHEGKMNTSDLKGRDPEFRKAVTAAMQRKYPDDSLSKHQRFNESYDEYASAKPGTAGARLQASKTAMEHIGQMEEQLKKLGNSDSRTYNTLRNKLANQMELGESGSALKAFQTGAAVTGGETASAYGANTEGGHEAFIKIFDPATPPKGAAAAMHMIREQMATRNKQADAALRQFAQSPGQHKMIDELGLAPKDAKSSSSETVSLRRKKDGKTVQVTPERAAAYQAKEPDAYEVVNGG